MKIGDRFPVNIQEYVVGEGIVENVEDGQVTILIPATRVVMGIRTSLTDIQREPEGHTVLLGTDEPPQKSEAPSAPAPSVSNDDVGDGLRNANLDSSVLD